MSRPTTAAEETIIDVEPVDDALPTRAEAISHAEITRPLPQAPGSPPAPMALFGTTDPVEIVEKATRVAKALIQPVEDQKLYLEKPDGRRYLNVEAWTLLASMLQVTAIPLHTTKNLDADGNWRPPILEERDVVRHSKWCHNGGRNHTQTAECETYTKTEGVMVEPGHGGWSARVEAYDQTGRRIGAADSECNWEEWKWRDRDSYAVKSMAQTRGISKALSGPLRFIVELAGFKGTPAEEIPEDETGDWASNGSGSGDTYTGPRCPVCDSPLYDNRANNEQQAAAGKKEWPAYKCTNRACTGGDDGREWITWKADYFDQTEPTDPSIPFKMEALEVVSNGAGAWVTRYDDPTSPDETTTQVIADGDVKQMAGILWRDVMAEVAERLVFSAEEATQDRKALRVTILGVRRSIEKPEITIAEAVAGALDLIEQADQTTSDDPPAGANGGY